MCVFHVPLAVLEQLRSSYSAVPFRGVISVWIDLFNLVGASLSFHVPLAVTEQCQCLRKFQLKCSNVICLSWSFSTGSGRAVAEIKLNLCKGTPKLPPRWPVENDDNQLKTLPSRRIIWFLFTCLVLFRILRWLGWNIINNNDNKKNKLMERNVPTFKHFLPKKKKRTQHQRIHL